MWARELRRKKSSVEPRIFALSAATAADGPVDPAESWALGVEWGGRGRRRWRKEREEGERVCRGRAGRTCERHGQAGEG